MERVNSIVGYDNLKIYQNDDWFKFSLESVLLPNFVKINLRDKEILDLCCGNGAISLFLTTKTKAHITGVEIQKEVYDLALKSIKLNELENQITLINDDLKNLNKYYETDYFDTIVINPPYFKNDENSEKNKDTHKSIARHELCATLDDILNVSIYLLKNNGHFVMVHRTERFLEIMQKLESKNLIPKRLQFIYPKENSNSNLFMIDCIKNGHQGLTLEKPLFVHNDDGTYRDEIKKIFKI